MTDIIADIVRRHCRPLAPRSTATDERLTPLPEIRAVLFDIYGTLLISGAGDITLQTGTSSDSAFRDALLECGAPPAAVSSLSADLLKDAIAQRHLAGREKGIAFPEVDIVEVWGEVLRGIDRNCGTHLASRVDAAGLAVEYEVRVNPLWPMPGLVECLSAITQRGLVLGVVSNAQAMTPEMFPALAGRTLAELGFVEDLLFYSYRFRESKPGHRMFQAAAAALDERNIRPDQAVFIGNDALNDVWAASQAGFRTILFAGDARSLRLRADDERVRHCTPDAVVTRLESIPDCLAR